MNQPPMSEYLERLENQAWFGGMARLYPEGPDRLAGPIQMPTDNDTWTLP